MFISFQLAEESTTAATNLPLSQITKALRKIPNQGELMFLLLLFRFLKTLYMVREIFIKLIKNLASDLSSIFRLLKIMDRVDAIGFAPKTARNFGKNQKEI